MNNNKLPRINRQIRSINIRLVASNGDMLGVVSIDEAMKLATDEGLDLIEISPNAVPPVCKIGDFGKLKYESQKKANEARKKQKIVETKEIKIRPTIGQSDYDVKMRHTKKFLADGDKVKISSRFRGREIVRPELVYALMNRIVAEIGATAKIEYGPKIEGRQMLMILAPQAIKQ